MGSSQSSPASHHHRHLSRSSKKDVSGLTMARGGGRKASGAYEEAPHGLAGSFVSEEPSATHGGLAWEDPSEVLEEEEDHVHHHFHDLEVVKEDEVLSVATELESSDEESEDEDEEEEDEEEKELWEERLRILEEVDQLKQVATFFLRPELPVTTEYGATSSAIFDRWAVSEPLPEPEELELEKERQEALTNLRALKIQAKVYLHPELPVQVDPACFGRNYFVRISAEPYEDEETDADRDDVLEDVKALQAAARQYRHPEDPVTVDATACGRNYFDRPSAEPQDDVEDDLERDYLVEDLRALKDAARQYWHPETSVPRTAAGVTKAQYSYPEDAVDEERAAILRDARLLQASARMYLHPEAPIVVDPACCGRNYFARVSADPYEEEEVDAGRDDVLEDVQVLKESARLFLHPEDPVQVDATTTARNYFGRPSALESVDVEDDLERDYLVEDLAAFKAAARQYLHPEVPVPRTAAAVTKSHAYHHEDELEDDRASILRDARLLKESAQMYLHPEAPIAVDPVCCGRNYFARVSAEPYEEEEIDADRDDVLDDVQALKASARHFSHPEDPVHVDAIATARNYFGRYSALESQDVEDDLEVEDLQSLKAAARQYLHPEDPVSVDSIATARNYFSRPSAEEQEDVEHDLDRDFVLGDVRALKMSAQNYLHPEVQVRSSAAVGRHHSYAVDEVDERAAILRDLQLLKTSATHFLHPEAPVTVDPEVCGRNYFARPSADLYESDEQVLEREEAIRDARALQNLAVQYAHPEAALAVDPTTKARSYFGRYAAPQPDDHSDEEAERELVLSDALALKKLAADFRHPEAALVGSVPGGRNYFDRPSAHFHDQMVHTFPAHEDDWHHDDDYYGHHHEHLDHFGMDEEMEARFEDLRQNLPKVAAASSSSANKTSKNRADGSDEEGGNLSRSPSSVMLFTDESIYD